MALFCAVTFFACEGNYKNIKKLNLTDGAPIAEGIGINLKYTDSGRLVANLLADKLLDYSNFSFPYKEFPEGVEVHYWGNDNKETIVTADYAVQYDKTNIIDMRKNVFIKTSDSVEVKATQLYWDQSSQWVYTEQPYQIKFKDGSYNDGAKFDSSQDFSIFLSQKNKGVQLIDKNKTNEQ